MVNNIKVNHVSMKDLKKKRGKSGNQNNTLKYANKI